MLTAAPRRNYPLPCYVFVGQFCPTPSGLQAAHSSIFLFQCSLVDPDTGTFFFASFINKNSQKDSPALGYMRFNPHMGIVVLKL